MDLEGADIQPTLEETFGGDPLLEGLNKDKSQFQNPGSGGYPEEKQLSGDNFGDNETSGIPKDLISPDPNNPVSLDLGDAGDGNDTEKLNNSSENDPLTKEPLDGDVSSLKHEAQGDPLIDPKSSSTAHRELGDGETVDDEDKNDSDTNPTEDNTEEPNNLTSLANDGDIENADDDSEVTYENQEDTEASTDTEDDAGDNQEEDTEASTDTEEDAGDDSEITDENQEDTEASTEPEEDAGDDSEITDENQEDTEASTEPEEDAGDDSEITDEIEEDAGDASFNPDLLKLQPKFDFDRGLFKVDATGQVIIDFLFDGGVFKPQMAIVSKTGIENFEYGSEEFIKEATRRALTNSELGHIVLDDRTDKAKFTGKLGEGNWNEGDYQSARTFTMTPGDEFFVMLIPNGTVQEVHDNPGIGGAKRPLFSLATANPNDTYHVGQIADITGDGSAFTFEDLRIDLGTDKDYNDIIFQVRGATAKAALMDEVVDPAKDWRNTDMGQALIEYVKAYITPESPTEGEDAIADEWDEPIDESSDSVDVPTDEATDDETEGVKETSEESDDDTDIVEDSTDESDETEGVDETSDESDDDTDIVEDSTDESDETEGVDETSDESDDNTEVLDEIDDETEVVDETSDETQGVDETSEESDDETDIVEDSTDESDDIEGVDETSEESDSTEVVEETSEESDDTEDAIASGIASPSANDASEPSEQNQIATELPQTEPSEDRDPIAANTQSSDTQTSNTPEESAEQADVATANNTNDSTNDAPAETTIPQQTAIAPSATPPAPAPVEPPVRFKFPQKNQPQMIVIDSAFTRNNPDIDESKITWGRDYIDRDADPTLQAGEGNEHGTHILGILAAKQDNGIGIDGINPQAPILASRAIGSGKWAEALKDGVDAAKASGQPNAVVNLSFDLTQVNPDGSVTTRYEFTPKEREALEYARQNNVLIVVAAGNNASIMSVLGQASQEFDNIITVGAAEQVDPTVSAAKGVDRANYSNKGRGLDIMAIGGTPEKPVLSTVGDGVGTMAGTSVATAKVTGAASLVWAANPKLNYRQVIDILKSTATDLKTPNWDRDTGAGLLNIKAAVHLAKATEPEEYNPAPFGIPTTWSGEGKVTASERAVNSKSIYLSTDLGEIVQFDLGTGQKRHIYQGEAFTDLAVAPNGKLYGSTFNHLYEINTSTGDETYIGRFGGPNINSLTFSPDGRLYGAEEKSGDVYEISPQTARLTYIGNLGGPSSGDMVFDGASQFFATVGSPSMERDRLVAFDLNTRRARTITELSNDQFYGLAMHNGQLIGYTARKQEIALDPLTGQINSISVVPVSGAIWGAAQNYTSVSYNPSPSSDWQRAMEREYQDMGWLLGNPTGPYANASRSPQGTEGKWRAYENGTIHWTPQHGAVAVWLDLQREYNEHGGSGGWLGFPTQREHDWKGGKRTLFEGGYIYWDGQRAKAYRHGELPTPDWQQAMEREYQDMGWLLGNPTGPYANASRSPQGTEGKWRAYENGTIHWTPQHGAVAVWLDLQREYNEHGGSGGWLGFPTQRERDWKGGKRTEFEGGFIYWDGQRATAYRNGEFVITKEHLDKFAQVAAKYPDIGGAIGPVTHNGDGVLQQNFQYGYIIWNGQQTTVYDTSEVSQESGTENTPISQNQPFRDYVFSSIEIDLRTSPTSSNHARSGIFAPPGLELAFEGWTYGETLTDLKTGEPNAIWYKFIDTEGTGQTFWVPSAWMGGFPPGNPPLVPPGGNSGSSGSGGNNYHEKPLPSGKGTLIRTGAPKTVDLSGLQQLLYGDVSTTVTSGHKQQYDEQYWPVIKSYYPDLLHVGYDIAAIGSYRGNNPTIYSPINGSVIGIAESAGLVLLYNESTNVTFRFLHMDSVAVSLNTTVKIGSPIGTEGRKGMAYGDHLHFDAWYGRQDNVNDYPKSGESIDPLEAVNSANQNGKGTLIR